MGISRLASLLSMTSTKGAASAFICELRETRWESIEAVASAYPEAALNQNCATIALGPGKAVCVRFDFQRQFALVEGVKPAAHRSRTAAP